MSPVRFIYLLNGQCGLFILFYYYYICFLWVQNHDKAYRINYKIIIKEKHFLIHIRPHTMKKTKMILLWPNCGLCGGV